MFLVLLLFCFVLILAMGKIDLALAWYGKCMCSSAFQADPDLMTAGVLFFYFQVLFGTNGCYVT
jgi:hypothetical protein